jgi:hypothetical protein
MLTKDYVEEVIVQGDYMSGDRNTIASALRVHKRLGVVVLAAPGHLKTAQELESLYKGAAGANRVAIHQVLVRSGGTSEDAVKASYRWVNDYVHRKSGVGEPKWIRTTVASDVKLQSATYGTKVIGNTFRRNAGEASRQLRQFWRLDKVQMKRGGKANLQPSVDQWLNNKGFRKDRAYVFLFTKQAGWSMKEDKRGPGDKLRVGEDRWAEKAHHFTSILTWRILQERIERETSVIPVATGDDIGLTTTPTLVQFWEKDDWKNLLANVAIDPRSAQLGMWCYLAEYFTNLSIIGMRSGMIEVPALLGIRTLYLEERHNEQAERMAKWIGTVPTFERQIVERPPGIKQQVFWKEQSLQSRDTAVRQHATNLGGHLTQVGMGFNSEDLAKEQPGTIDGNVLVPPGDFSRTNFPKLNAEARGEKHSLARAQALARAVFGTRGLAPTIATDKFKLEASEFNSIIEWIKKTPAKATGAVYGSVVADGEAITGGPIIDCKKQDEIHQKLMSERNIDKWSKYFASEEYRKKIGVGS